MSIVLAVIGSVLSPILTVRAARKGLLGWILGPIVGFFSSFLIAATIAASVSYYWFGAPVSVINAGEGVFVWIFWIAVIPTLVIHAVLVLGTVR